MGVKERVLQFIKDQNISVSEFERRGNLSNGYVKNFKGSFGEGKLNDILSAFPSLNRVWLLTGVGNMLLDETAILNKEGEKEYTLPLLPIDVMAGKPAVEMDTITLAQCEQYAVPDFIYYGAQMLIRVSGESMAPRYNNGDIIALKEVLDMEFFQWGKIYVLDTSQGALVKRLYEDKGNPDNVICHSENDALFHDFSMPKTSIRKLFIVIGVIRIE